jgi:hypothetical protein
MTASTSFESDFRSFTSHNIIGILPGSEAPEEYVLHTAHWDHLGRCTPAPDGDDICNGAADNATGTAGLVAMAEALVIIGLFVPSTAILVGAGEGKNRWREIISSGICEVMSIDQVTDQVMPSSNCNLERAPSSPVSSA